MTIRLRKATRLLLAAAILIGGTAQADVDADAFYKTRCSSCHGAKGEGTENKVPQLAPALKGNPFVMNAPPAALATVIRKGRSGANRLYDKSFPNMPGFGPEAVPDIQALIEYMKGALQQP